MLLSVDVIFVPSLLVSIDKRISVTSEVYSVAGLSKGAKFTVPFFAISFLLHIASFVYSYRCVCPLSRMLSGR